MESRSLQLISNLARKQLKSFILRCKDRNTGSVKRWQILPNFSRVKVYSFCIIPVVHVAFGVHSKALKRSSSMQVEQGKDEIIRKADELYLKNEVDQLYSHLVEFKESIEPDILWRLARATCDKAKSTSDKSARKELMFEAFGYAELALKHGNDSNFACHKWYAIMLDYIGEYEGTKERISKAYMIRDHFLKAIELNNKDATSVHLLGYWCFVFADLPWYQQKLAALIFASPPTSTYKEALDYFLQAEKIDPGFYSMNFLMIGKTYLRLKETNLAREYLTRALEHPVQSEDDKKAHKEASDLLKTM